jgi:hypothetical protein
MKRICIAALMVIAVTPGCGSSKTVMMTGPDGRIQNKFSLQ